jgi:hypothetical protein
MKRTAALAILVLFSAFAFGKDTPAISLKPVGSEKSMETINTLNIYGSCGTSVVAIFGIQADRYDEGSSSFQLDSSGQPDLVLREYGKSTSFGQLLSDFNVVQCVKTTKGELLLVASHCGGSACSDHYDFYVIDPLTKKLLDTAGSGSCNAKCASKILGNRLPLEIDGER